MNDTNTRSNNNGRGGGTKRSRRQGGNGNDDDDDAYHQAYTRVRFHPIASTGRPGTPHCYFAESYAVEEIPDADKFVEDDKEVAAVQQEQQQRMMHHHHHHHQVVHKHANGLVIVTAGGPDLLSSSMALATSASPSAPADATLETAAKADTNTAMDNNDSSNMMMTMMVQSIDFKVQEAAVASQNAASKRKHQGKMLKGKRQVQQEVGIVRPNDVLAVVNVHIKNNNNNTGIDEGKEVTATATSSSISIPLSCCVWGTILERNHVNLEKNPALLQQDPLLDGYLAVVLPTGPFPPPSLR